MSEPPEHLEPDIPAPNLPQVAATVGVTAATVRRWVDRGLVPGFDGTWTPAAVAYVRVVARLRARGHSLERIKQASDDGQLAIGPIENLLSSSGARHSLRQVSRASGLAPELIRRMYSAMGLGPLPAEGLTDEDLQMMRYAAAVLAAGFPLPAYLQLLRVYGQVMAQIADAEVRLMHLYVHKPLMRAGVPNVEIAEEMEEMAREVLPLASPFISYLHGRLLAHFVEQDMIGHMEAELGDEALEEGRVRVAIAFADLAGYARLTVEQGDEAAVSTVERFVDAVGANLP
ncbi:MAG: adenylate cyclase regulatory domain-containing protein, partial [Solirubrobacteraceae bacterium]